MLLVISILKHFWEERRQHIKKDEKIRWKKMVMNEIGKRETQGMYVRGREEAVWFFHYYVAMVMKQN